MDRHSMSATAGGGGSAGGGGLSPSNGARSDVAKFRASIDAARSLYSNGAGAGYASGGNNSPNLGGGAFPPRSAGPGGSKRPSSDMLNSSFGGFGQTGSAVNAENDAIDKWFEDLHHYEATLEEMAAASLDQSFKEELGAIEQWFKVLSEAERTAALYSLLQTSSQVQIRFFITVLQQMARSDPMNALLSPANPQQASMEAQMDAKLASLGLKTPASPAMRQFARQSLGAMPITDPASAAAANFLSPNSAMLQPPQSARSVSASSIPSQIAEENSTDAATLLAQQRARLNANAANRISAPGSLLSAHDHTSLRSPLWSQANSEQVAERSTRSPSPDGRASNAGRSRPTSMISDHGLPSHSSAGNVANNLSPNLGAGGANNTGRMPGASTGLSINSDLPNLADAQLSPMVAQNWAAMMATPLMSSFGPTTANADSGTFPNLMNSSTNGNAQSDAIRAANWAAHNQNNSNIVLDDAKKFRRNARSSDAGLDGGVQGIMSGMLDKNAPPRAGATATANTNTQANNAANAAAVAAQQNWRNINGLLQQQNGQPQTAGLQSPDLSNQIAANFAALQNMNSGVQSPQMAMANLLAAQQQIQQQMQIQQLMAGMSPMGMMNTLQNQQMLSPVLGAGGLGMGMGMGMMGQPQSANSRGERRSPRPGDRSASGGARLPGFGGGGFGETKSAAPIIPGSGTNPDEPLDMKLLGDTANWLRSLRLHKYTSNFEKSSWREMVAMDDAALEAQGVAALGARRKLLKVFENVRNLQGIPHPPGSEARPASPAGSNQATNDA